MESVISVEPITKLCSDCKTGKTPLWRTGPAGPKSLCNACGIRYRKKRSVVVGSDKKKLIQPPSPTSSSSSTIAGNGENDDGGGERRIELVAVEKEVVILQRRRSPVKKMKSRKIEKGYRKFGEVEEAAFVLMSLSCGLVFA